MIRGRTLTRALAVRSMKGLITNGNKFSGFSQGVYSVSCLYSTNHHATTVNTMHQQQQVDVVEALEESIQQIIKAIDATALNKSFMTMHTIFTNKLRSQSDIDRAEKIFTEYCSSPEKVYIGYIGRAYLYLYTHNYEKAKDDALTLELVDAFSGLKKGGTGITDNRIVALAFHLLFSIYKQLGQSERLEYCTNSSLSTEPQFAFTNLQRAQWLMGRSDIEMNKDIQKMTLKLLDDSVERLPEYEEGYYVRGLFYQNIQKDAKRAAKDFKKVLELNPNHSAAKAELESK